MNREIKFRVWDFQNLCFIKDWSEIAIFNGAIPINDYFIKDGHEVNRWHFVQYTGLKDKNGKEIYEGDILKYQSDAIRKVIYKQAAFHSVTLDEALGSPNHPLYFTTLAPAGTSEIEIIGNIYENPELLKQ